MSVSQVDMSPVCPQLMVDPSSGEWVVSLWLLRLFSNDPSGDGSATRRETCCDCERMLRQQ
jgi:hypothetical protein